MVGSGNALLYSFAVFNYKTLRSDQFQLIKALCKKLFKNLLLKVKFKNKPKYVYIGPSIFNLKNWIIYKHYKRKNY